VIVTSDYWAAVNCQNNLKQIHLFAQIWFNDHAHYPQSLAEMTNFFGNPIFGWPTILFCRADKARTAPPDWPVNYTNTSYELLSGSDTNYSRVLCRCKVHGLYVLLDGTAPSAPLFTKARRLSGSVSELSVVLLSNKTNVLETSSNLSTWSVLNNYIGQAGSFLFYETNSASRGFYRMRLQ
jgi:hypothetical protein